MDACPAVFVKEACIISIRYFDCHCDTIWRLHETGEALEENTGHIDLHRASCYAPYVQMFALWDDARLWSDPGQAQARFHALLDTAIALFEKNRERIVFCKSADDLRAAVDANKSAALLMVEGAELLGEMPNALDVAFEAGVKAVTITWNHENVYGCPAAVDEKKGLTARGRELVRALEQRRMFVDVSHLSERGFWDVAECASCPFIATHSNARAVCSHRRNLTDEQLNHMIRTGGICGINLYDKFVKDGGGSCIMDVLRHIDHILSLGGAQVLAVGGDLDGCDMLPTGIDGVEDVGKIYTQIEKAFGSDIARAVFFDNMYRFICRQI